MRLAGFLGLLLLATFGSAQRQTIIDENGNSVVVSPSIDGDGDTVYRTLSTIGVSSTSSSARTRSSSSSASKTALGPVGAPTCNQETGEGCTTNTYYYQTTLADGEVVSTAWTPTFKTSYSSATATVAAGTIADYSSFQSQQNSAVAAADASLRAAASPSGGASHLHSNHVVAALAALGILIVV